MPRIIRNALYQKLRNLPELRQFQSDFESLSGLKLAFVDELGLGDDSPCTEQPVCAEIRCSEAGRALCARTKHALLAGATQRYSSVTCDAGLNEAAVPVKVSGIHAGFLVFGGTAAQIPSEPALHRIRHLLEKSGIPVDSGNLRDWYATNRQIPAATFEAYLRIANLAAQQIALIVTDQLATPEATMPPAVLKACGYIRSKALMDDINLVEVASHCGISEGHLSRLFHRTTGLTFREYISQVRIDRAKSLLLNTNKTVTEIAYESGFQSLSQFHRAFRKAHQTSPGKLRADASPA